MLAAGCTGDPPDIDVPAVVDLGAVAKGEKARGRAPVRNRGGRVLRILAVSTSCGCTEARVTPVEVPPGGVGTLTVVYDSSAHASDAGPIERFVFLATNDPDEGDVPVEVRVEVRRVGPRP